MTPAETDVVIVGAGPVGLMCAHLGQLCGLRTVVLDKSEGPLQVGRADALNARSLQLLEIAGVFEDLYPLGKPCNTSSVWADGRFVSRQSAWWEALEGCLHKHFLILGQSNVERCLDVKLRRAGSPVRRKSPVSDVQLLENACRTTLASGETIRSKFVIGSDGSRSFIRERFEVSFALTRPQITWAVIDGVIESDFLKVPEIIVFQADTSDVAWIPREGSIDRFYVRMDTKDFTFEEAVAKINRAMRPHTLRFREIAWSSQFSVKESVADRFVIEDRIFLAGDAAHIHSVNGGQGLNTGLGDAFNLMWKINMVLNHGPPATLLRGYETERKAVAMSIVETAGELVRSTKHSPDGTHAEDYVKIVRRRAGNVTGMGIRYGEAGLRGTRLFDLAINKGGHKSRLYSLLDYTRLTLLVFGDVELSFVPPPFERVLRIASSGKLGDLWADENPYARQWLLVRPDAVIAVCSAEDGSTEWIPSHGIDLRSPCLWF